MAGAETAVDWTDIGGDGPFGLRRLCERALSTRSDRQALALLRQLRALAASGAWELMAAEHRVEWSDAEEAWRALADLAAAAAAAEEEPFRRLLWHLAEADFEERLQATRGAAARAMLFLRPSEAIGESWKVIVNQTVTSPADLVVFCLVFFQNDLPLFFVSIAIEPE